MSGNRFFGEFDGNMTRKLIKRKLGILFNIKKSKQSLPEILSLSGHKGDIFSC